MRWLTSKQPWIIGGAFVAPLLVLAGWMYVTTNPIVEPSLAPPVQPVFTLEHIDGIEWVFQSIGEMETMEPEPGPSIHAAILPHHSIVGEQLAFFWKTLASRSDPSVIVVIGPAHENQGSTVIQTTDGIWQTPVGYVKTDTHLVDQLVLSGLAAREPDSFQNEHAIGVHIPYIATRFPGVDIIPLIAQSSAGEMQARQLVSELLVSLPEDALVIASIDFSHYLPTATSDERDAETLSRITARDYDRIDTLGTEYLDSPFALDAYLLWSDMHQWQQELVWHENSGRIVGQLDAPGTSYLVFFAQDPVVTDEVVITAAGDIILTRGVATALSRTTVDAAFAEAALALAGGDIVFANLESILSTSRVENNKEIRFKADPARVDALHRMGITHVSVANNHNEDYGETAWNESLAYLDEAGIVTVGGYRNDGVPVVTPVGTHQVVMVAFEDLIRRVPHEQLIEQVRAASAQGDLVVVSIHWGVEYVHQPLPSHKELAHAFIDAGADVVLGHHPHVLQEIETYRDGLIFYSLGNFVFDQIGSDENESLVVRLTIDAFGNSAELIPMRIQNTFPRATTESERASTLSRLATWSGSELTDQILAGTIYW